MGNHIGKTRRREEKIREAPTLPLEILLCIFARADPVTLVRCAAASKHMRRHIADPAFLRLYHADAGFVPSLLVGMFHQEQYGRDEAQRFVPMSPSCNLMLQLWPPTPADGLFDSYVPVASRAGLVLLRRSSGDLVELCVCSPVTGRYSFLPTTTKYDCSHLLLPGDDRDNDDNAGLSFRLLLVDFHCRTQTFSSRTSVWGPFVETPAAAVLRRYKRVQPAAVVLRGIAHWLYRDNSSERYQVLAVRIDTGQAAAIEIPQCCLRRRRSNITWLGKELLLVSSADRRLSLLVAETVAISLWTFSEDSRSWAPRRVVVDRATMLRSVKLQYHPLSCVRVELEWFGERSGAVIFQMAGAGILVLNLQTNEISQFSRSLCIHTRFQYCPYEMDLNSLFADLQQ